MISSRRFRAVFITAFILATAGMALWAIVLLGPAWREHSIREACLRGRGPEFWWPASWRQEYDAVSLLIRAVRARQASGIPGVYWSLEVDANWSIRSLSVEEGIEAVEKTGRTDTAAWLLTELLDHEREEVRQASADALKRLRPAAATERGISP